MGVDVVETDSGGDFMDDAGRPGWMTAQSSKVWPPIQSSPTLRPVYRMTPETSLV
ncbi:hypothetical protein ACIP80_33215 [Streptomyces sp. NPDC088555]|uniref:hypothetical protein n=1 Tax=Streptomyces sp. NPDC088555 TaxID=3365866 RepID=UPI003828415F